MNPLLEYGERSYMIFLCLVIKICIIEYVLTRYFNALHKRVKNFSHNMPYVRYKFYYKRFFLLATKLLRV